MLWITNYHYHARENPILDHVWGQLIPVHSSMPLYFNIILPSTPGSSKLSLPLEFPDHMPYALIISTMRLTCRLPPASTATI
jgi:hypothetical protein